MPEKEMQPLVDAWRAANPNIVAFWSALGRAARTVIRKKTSVRVGKVTLYWQDDKMFMRLPSGRNLCYVTRLHGRGLQHFRIPDKSVLKCP